MEQDKAKAVELYRQAAEAGHVRAQCNLGFCYYRGIGVEEDNDQAVAWFKRAADGGYLRAIHLLAECHENGYGVEKDEVRAAQLYRSAHEQGYSPSTCALGVCYEYGDGVEKDEEKAVELFLEGKLPYLGIAELIEEAMGRHKVIPDPTVEEILETEQATYACVMEGKGKQG